MLRRITKFAAQITRPDAATTLVRKALDTAVEGRRGPVFLSVPMNVSASSSLVPASITGGARTSYPIDPESCQRACELIAGAERPLLLAGAGARDDASRRALLRFAEAEGVPVAVTPKGKGVFPEDHPLYLGVFGFGGHESVIRYLEGGVDVLLVCGSGLNDFSTNAWSPLLRARDAFLQIDIETTQLGKNYPIDLGLLGPMAPILEHMLASRPGGPAPRRRFEGEVLTQPLPRSSYGALTTAEVVSTMNEVCPADSVFTADMGEHLGIALHYLKIRAGGDFVTCLGFGSMGSGVCAAIGLQMGAPTRHVYAICGDGCFLMFGSELATAVQHHVPVTFVIINDSRLNMCHFGQHDLFGASADFSTQLVDFAALGRSMGATSHVMSTRDELCHRAPRAEERARGARRTYRSERPARRQPADRRAAAVPVPGARMNVAERSSIKSPVGIRSLAVQFPSVVRTNEYWRARYPEIVAASESRTLAQVFNPKDSTAESLAFDVAMRPFVFDVFRGTVERRALGPGETQIGLEQRAASEAIAAAGLSPDDIDLMICCSFLPENLGLGDAAFLVQRLGLRCPAWNLESTCSGALIAFQTACAHIRAGDYRNVLVVVSCAYSPVMDEEDTLSWFLGDGIGAFVVGPLRQGQGLLATKNVHTAETCGAFFWDLVNGKDGGPPRVHVKAGKSPGRALRDTSAPLVRACCAGAAEAAGVKLGDIDFFVFNTPVAWYHDFAARALEIDPARTFTTYPMYANIGPALTVANMYHAAQAGHLREDALVLVFAIGSVSNAAASVMRWGDVKLGPAPTPSSELTRV